MNPRGTKQTFNIVPQSLVPILLLGQCLSFSSNLKELEGLLQVCLVTLEINKIVALQEQISAGLLWKFMMELQGVCEIGSQMQTTN